MTASTTTDTSKYRIPIGRRIQEILDERGAAYLVGFFANRIRFSPHRLVEILNGTITPTHDDLEKIAKGLGISVDRLCQTDTAEQAELLRLKLQKPGNTEETLAEAEALAKIALGATERCDALNNLGKAYLRVGRMDDAHSAFQDAYRHYKPVMDQHLDYDRLFRLFSNLIFSYNAREEYEGLIEILQSAETIQWQDPVQSGMFFFASALVHDRLGKIEEAKQRFHQSLISYQTTGNQTLIGRAEYNIGLVEYLTGNFVEASTYLDSALHKLAEDRAHRVKVAEHLAHTLIELGELERAEAIIEEYKDALRESPQVLAMLYLKHAFKLNDHQRLARVLGMDIVDKPVKEKGYKYLMKHAAEINDSLAVLEYIRLYLQVDSDPSSFEDMMAQRRE